MIYTVDKLTMTTTQIIMFGEAMNRVRRKTLDAANKVWLVCLKGWWCSVCHDDAHTMAENCLKTVQYVVTLILISWLQIVSMTNQDHAAETPLHKGKDLRAVAWCQLKRAIVTWKAPAWRNRSVCLLTLLSSVSAQECHILLCNLYFMPSL